MTTFWVQSYQVHFIVNHKFNKAQENRLKSPDTLFSDAVWNETVFYTEWYVEVGLATHLCGPLGISRTVNLNCATNSPGHEKKENIQQG